jgi:hypothetical protein
MIETPQGVENLTLTIVKEMHVKATLEVTFDALLEELGGGFQTPEGVSLSMKLEPWPGGRWYRDLGENNGHFWGHVQAIRRPTLLEMVGPLFSSSPLLSNVQYRLTEMDGGTKIAFRHTALGFIEEQHRAGMNKGWAWVLERVRKGAEGR